MPCLRMRLAPSLLHYSPIVLARNNNKFKVATRWSAVSDKECVVHCGAVHFPVWIQEDAPCFTKWFNHQLSLQDIRLFECRSDVLKLQLDGFVLRRLPVPDYFHQVYHQQSAGFSIGADPCPSFDQDLCSPEP